MSIYRSTTATSRPRGTANAWRTTWLALALVAHQLPAQATSFDTVSVVEETCGCSRASIEARFRQASSIFRGTIERGYLEKDSNEVLFTVSNTTPLRGDAPSSIELTTPLSDDCGIRIVANADWVFMLYDDQRTIRRCDLPSDVGAFGVDALAVAITLLENYDRSPEEARRVLAPLLSAGTSAMKLKTVLQFVQQLDSSKRVVLETHRLVFETLSVSVSRDEVVFHEWP